MSHENQDPQNCGTPTIYDMLDELRTNYGYVHDDLQVPVSLQKWAESVTKLLGVLAQGSQK